MYDLDKRVSFEMDASIVPSQFPFVYFSDNAESVYMYQIPVYTFQARQLTSLDGVDATSYFAFNAMDRKMEFHKVTSLNQATSELDKLFTAMSGKMLLRAGFVYKDFVYLLTADSIYVVNRQQMQKNPIPDHTKVSLREFLQCEASAISKNLLRQLT